jgi:putative protease
LTVNIYAHNEDIGELQKYLNGLRYPYRRVNRIGPGRHHDDKRDNADAEIHLSTQANMTNYKTAEFWPVKA